MVKGEKQLKTCDFLDHHKKESHSKNPNNEVKVTFETAAEVINNQQADDNHGREVDDNEIEDEVELLRQSATRIIDQKVNRKTKRDVYRDRNGKNMVEEKNLLLQSSTWVLSL